MDISMLEARQKFTREERLLALILAIGAILRFWHIAWSLPDMYEEAYPFAIAWKFWRWGEPGITLNPDFFHYPALTFYLQFALQSVHYGIGRIAGSYADLSAFRQAYEQDPTLFIASARALSASFDIGAIVLAYLLARRWFGTTAALVAALAMALNPLLVLQSQLVGVDTPMTFFVLLALYLMARSYDEPTLRNYLLTGIAVGLAASAKYNGALLLVPFAVAHFWRKAPGEQLQPRFTPLLAASAAAALTFLVLNPYTLLNHGRFLSDFSYEQRHMATGHLGVDASQSSLIYYLFEALPGALGWPMVVAAGAGLALAAAGRHRRLAITALFPVIYLVVIGSWEMRADRYLLPILPSLLIIAAGALSEFWEWIAKRSRSRLVRWASGGALLLFVLTPPVVATISYHRTHILPDTRTEAKEWILKEIPDGSVIVTGPFGMRIPERRFTTLLIPFTPTGAEALAPFYDPRWYDELELLIASDYDYGRFAREPDRYRGILRHYERLRSTWTLAAEFHPGQHQSGPTVWLYRPPGAPADRFDDSLFVSLAAIAETTFVTQFAENLASVLFSKGKLAKCGQIMEAAIALQPGSTRLLNSYAWTLFKEKRYIDALPLAERSLAADPLQAEVIALRGSVLLRLGDDRRAEEDLVRALGMNRRLEVTYLDLELLYRMRNDRERQEAVLRQYLEILPPESENARRTREYLLELERR